MHAYTRPSGKHSQALANANNTDHIDYAYDSRGETLEDDEGSDINWRVIGVENDSDEDGEDGD